MSKKKQLSQTVNNHFNNGIFPDIFKVVINDSFQVRSSEKDIKQIIKFFNKQEKLIKGLK